MMRNRATILRCWGLLIAVGVLTNAAAGETPPATTGGNVDPFTLLVQTAPPTPSAKLTRYAKRVIGRYDTSGDGLLQNGEWKSMAGNPAAVDANQDGTITADEYAAYAAAYGRYRRMLLLSPNPPANAADGDTPQAAYESPPEGDDVDSLRRTKKFYVPNSRLPKGLSQEFFKRDLDGDGQLTLSEYAPKSTAAELERFKRFDANLDGVITAREYTRGPQAGTPQPDETQVTPPQATPVEQP